MKPRGHRAHTYGMFEGKQANSRTIGYWPDSTERKQVRTQQRKGIFKRWLKNRGDSKS